MRKKMITAVAAGALTLGGVAVAVPAMAAAPDGTSQSAVERITEALSGLVTDGSLTQEQADEVASTLSGAGISDRGGHGGGRLQMEAAATALTMTEDELRAALDVDGTSLADVAAEQGVPVDTLIEALVTAAQEDIAQAVTDGELTQEQADERLAGLQERVTERVDDDSDRPAGGPGSRGGGGPTGD